MSINFTGETSTLNAATNFHQKAYLCFIVAPKEILAVCLQEQGSICTYTYMEVIVYYKPRRLCSASRPGILQPCRWKRYLTAASIVWFQPLHWGCAEEVYIILECKLAFFKTYSLLLVHLAWRSGRPWASGFTQQESLPLSCSHLLCEPSARASLWLQDVPDEQHPELGELLWCSSF